MRRRLSVLIAFIGLLGMIGFAPVAQAGHDLKAPGGPGPHEGSPIPVTPEAAEDTGVCAVDGTVAIGNAQGSGGVDLLPDGEVNHNHYRFQDDTIITCQGLNRYNKTFNVEAAGGTDGGDPMGTDFNDPTLKPDHGESASVGWSHSSCYANSGSAAKAPLGCAPPAVHPGGKNVSDIYNGLAENPEESGQCTNCGEIVVRSMDDEKVSDPNAPGGSPLAANNWVKFCRGVYLDGTAVPTCTGSTDGANVIAWGALTNITGKAKPANEVVCFWADLVFVPEAPAMGSTKATNARLEGTALIWLETDPQDCAGQKGKK